MVSTRKIAYRSGRGGPRGERISRFVARNVRLGARIQLQQLATVPINPHERALLEQYVHELRSQKSLPHTPKYDRILGKIRVLRTSVALEKELGRKPTPHQMLAVTALRHGLRSEELVQLARSMNTIECTRPREVTWEGRVTRIYHAIITRTKSGETIPVAAERELFAAPGRAVSSKELCTPLGIKWGTTSASTLNAAMQFLETCKLVKKLPEQAVMSGNISMWAHAAHPNPRIDYPNPSINILMLLSRGAKKLSELLGEGQTKTRKADINAAAFGIDIVPQRLITLQKSGLVQQEKKSYQATTAIGKKRNYSYREYSLTPIGKKLYETYERTGHLPEQLRKLIIGEGKNA